MQHTPNPLAQLPEAEPPDRSNTLDTFRPFYTLLEAVPSFLTQAGALRGEVAGAHGVGGGAGGAGSIRELDDAQRVQQTGLPASGGV